MADEEGWMVVQDWVHFANRVMQFLASDSFSNMLERPTSLPGYKEAEKSRSHKTKPIKTG